MTIARTVVIAIKVTVEEKVENAALGGGGAEVMII